MVNAELVFFTQGTKALIPTILGYLETPKDCAHAALACKTFFAILEPRLNVIKQLATTIDPCMKAYPANDRDPRIQAVKALANEIFELTQTKKDCNVVQQMIHEVLVVIGNRSYALQNHLIEILAQSWEAKHLPLVFQKAISLLSADPLFNKANWLHLVTNFPSTRPIFSSPDLSREASSIGGPQHQDETPFDRAPLDPKVVQSLRIRGQNTFKLGEIVAVDHQGNLVSGLKKPFLGVVRNIKPGFTGAPLYVISTHMHKGVWIDKVTLSPDQIGKIPNPPS